MVPASAGRHDQVRREPAEEVPGHLPVRLRVGGLAGAVARAEGRDRVLDRARRDDLPRRQPAHQAVPLLGVGARRDPQARTPRRSSSPRRSRGRRSCATSRRSGFSQSYSYFTWRNAKAEIEEYFTELTQTEVARVHAAEPVRRTRRTSCTSTCRRAAAGVPGAPGARRDARRELRHLQRLRAVRERARCAKAARSTSTPRSTRSGRAISRPPAASRRLIARVNAIRRAHPALQFDRGLEFHETDNEQLICYTQAHARRQPTRSSSSSTSIRSTCSTATSSCRSSTGRSPPGTVIEAHDLLSDETYMWTRRVDLRATGSQTRVAHVIAITSSVRQSPIRQSPIRQSPICNRQST